MISIKPREPRNIHSLPMLAGQTLGPPICKGGRLFHVLSTRPLVEEPIKSRGQHQTTRPKGDLPRSAEERASGGLQ